MASVVEICNMALGNVGVGQLIASISEGSAGAQRCRLYYENCRDQVLRDFDWPFARRYEALGLVEETPNTEWTFAYRYPSSGLAIRRILGVNRSEVPRVPFAVGSDGTGKLIYTDASEAVARLTVQIIDSEQFDPIFVGALSYLLASRVGPGLARDAKLVAASYQLYGEQLAAARAVAANEGGQDEPPDAESISVRG